MSHPVDYPLTLKELEVAIRIKAHQMNEELNNEFYSYDSSAYEFIDITSINNYQLLMFRCPKSRSTISLKIKKRKIL